MKPGIYHNLPFSEYLEAEQINASALKLINSRTPAHYYASLSKPNEETQAMKIGSAIHCAVLEPAIFSDKYLNLPDNVDGRTNSGKAIIYEAKQSGKVVLTKSEYDLCNEIAISVRSSKSIGNALKNGDSELSVFTDDRKCRLDHYNSGNIFDLKTCNDASPKEFAKQIYNFGYHIQAAWYLDTCKIAGLKTYVFIFIAVEKAPPYAIGLYELGHDSLEAGRIAYLSALDKLERAKSTGEWTGHSEYLETIELPYWALNQDY
jgi:exodeoxyribonuclease VIII